MRRIFLASMGLLFSGSLLFSQNKPTGLWSFIPETKLQAESQQRQIVPVAYKTLHMDVTGMKALLAEAPMWQTPAADNETVVLALPMPDGTFQDFRIVEAPVMHPDLGKQYPMIRSYAGIGLDDPTAYLRFDMTQRGFHAMVLTAQSSTVFIDPYSTADIEHYISYYKKDFKKDEPFECLFDDVNKATGTKHPAAPPSMADMAGDCTFRTYVLALACTGEYATFHGGTTALALAAMNTSMTRVNGVFENDCSIHMDLHPNTASLIYLNANTDPYTNNNGSAMLGQNQTTCDNVIGNANYDIGHVFSTGGGGVAYLGALCNSSNKAGGVTGSSNPVGDPFDIDYVAHEMGHQYGGNHTFSSSSGSCSGNQNSGTAMEVGSGTTIMAYAGICSPQNVQNNSDDYFHAISLQEIAAEVTSGTNGGSGNGGNTCSTNTSFNSSPTANAGLDYTIPKSTPFVLTGSGSDPNGDPITYTWEQMNNQVLTALPSPTNTTGPAFRSFKGTTSPNRYLPRLQDLVNNVSPTWEVLASVSRTYAWRLTVRDNHVGGGCTAEDNMVVTVSNTSGPFLVTAPNTAVTWPALSTQTITWDVANTTAAPVSAANVDIFLSLDGGFTYPVTLATATPNDGSQVVTIPNNQTTQARVMVRGSGNIFFDISNTNFTIGPPENTFSLDVTPASQSVCAPVNAVFNINIGVLGTFSGNVTLSATGVPSGASLGFSNNPVAAPGTSQMTLSNLAAAAPGIYDITVTGTSGVDQHSKIVTLTLGNAAPGQVVLSSPANNATGVSLTPQLTWAAQPGGTTYDLQVATDAGFSNLIVNQTGLTAASYPVATSLSANTVYYWKVRAVNPCGTGSFSTPFSFTTLSLTCTTFASTDVPKTISSSGTPTVTSTLNIGPAGTITDVNVLNLSINHTYINDLIVKLKSPATTERTLLSQICGSQNNILTNLDDESANPYNTIPCPPTNNGTYQPYQALSAFDGENLNGTWTLTINDVANQDGGSLQAWSLQVCYVPPAPPLNVVASGTNVTCNGGNNGSATATATGGSGGYLYAWSNGGMSQTINNLTAGTYTVTVTSGSATSTASYTVTQPAAIVVNAPSITQPTCSAPTGTLVINTTGGGGPLEYSVDDGASFQASPTFSGLAPNGYEIVVRLVSDPSCSAGYAGNPVIINAVPGAPAVSAPTVTQPTCSDPLGSMVVNASGGGPLEYSIDNGATFQASATFSGLSAGAYDIVVRLQSDPTCTTAFLGNPVALNAAAGCCPATLAVDLTPIPDGTYEAQMDITSNGLVPNGGNVLFGAWNSVELQADFEVALGGIFEILLQGCTP
ncbi:MAG: proprotein convertase P-domain-containing protein [Lewinellaceae bacterium]|nr:proprotein convertase P-domain-containing protein [Lewinellaceae bacterium]